MNDPLSRYLSRRSVLKLLAGGTLALYIKPPSKAFGEISILTGGMLSQIGPIDRTLQGKAEPIFFGDDPERAHKVLWDKKAFFSSVGGKVPAVQERVPLVVIGGGMSGLSSAYLLRKYRPVVLEQAPRFGGNSQGQSWRGIDYSIGAAYFIEPEEDSPVQKFLAEFDIDKLWKVKEGEDPVANKGTIYNKFWTGETTEEPARGQFEKLVKYFTALNNNEDGLIYPDIPIEDPTQEGYIKELDRVSFKSYLEKIVGGSLHPHIATAVEQYCWSSFDASASEIGAASGLNFYGSEFGNIVVLPGGNAAVAEQVLMKLAKELPANHLRAGSLVFDVSVKSDGVVVAYQDPSGVLHSIHAKAVVMACPKFVVAKILNDLEPERLTAIKRLQYRSYLVANVLFKGGTEKLFYDLYLLGENPDFSNIMASAQKQKITDVVLASFAKPDKDNTVLTFYRGMPYEGARVDLYAPGAYNRYREVFEKQIHESILPLLGLKKENIEDLRITRWGHPMPVAATGLIAEGIVDQIRKPFRNRVFFVEQDNWALPAFETAVTEALIWSEKVKQFLK